MSASVSTKQGQLGPADAKALGEARESWCAVERQKEESWCRKTRKHHKEQFTSTVFDTQIQESEPRCTFEVNKPTHRERRHFHSKYNCQLKI